MVVNVTDYLEQTAKAFPDKAAFIDEHRRMTYTELRMEARHIAMELFLQGWFKEPIAIFLEKSSECIAAFMGVAYSGNFYTPLDVNMPISRIEKILNTLKPRAILTDRSHLEIVKNFADSTKVFLYEDMLENQVEDDDLEHVMAKIIDTDVLYVLFTSGSTGTPKGVTVPHRGVITYTEWCSEEFDINENTILGNQTPFYFSMSVLDIFQSLKNGCTTYIIPRQLFSFPVKLLEFIAEKQINMIYWVPTALCIVANLKALGHVDISCLKNILFAGEVMPTRQLNMWRDALPNAEFANLFGPTEVTDICTFYKLSRALCNEESVPIGIPCRNSGIIILDENDREVDKDGTGELCVTGSTLAYGYYNNPQKTREVFTLNPINEEYPEIIYRTGDLVKYNKYGELVYVSRKDFQIKHMGHRIELGEIETAVSALDGIARCCCLYDDKKAKIVLFYTGTIDGSYISKQLKNMIPEYMMPNRKIKLAEMPLNLNGKIDRVKLEEKLV
ncbi:MAG: amino acid adenylation domain-containing protein [Schwartzia succinivorans]|uniref:amino acid adenylation domain-containing protein n=1 Tax=Schwartzia succinivorans TaxID=55507 RepID=UPI0023546779|nr:amino acid adenylation domain-containing protein [Schwartzia succinivorans]MBE6097706.1 amino acid adenylation domain-containing protein [Schwartzia succinivorans]